MLLRKHAKTTNQSRNRKVKFSVKNPMAFFPWHNRGFDGIFFI